MKYTLDGLQGKVCIITGGGGIIGTSLAIGLGNAGAKIAIVDFVKEKADEVQKKQEQQPSVCSVMFWIRQP
jgi:NAD(P)-dependent dehydrogenase (short-subunit alcohol dehydrogenase family)